MTDVAAGGAALLAIARSALIEAVSGTRTETAEPPESLREERATFVTLTRHGELRGCIGTLEPRRSLYDDVRENARAAALRDTRFAPVGADELDDISVEVSVLSPLREIEHRDEDELLAILRPGVDGLVIAHEARRATFLPQVWESLPHPRAFVQALKTKAGLARDFWSDDLRAWRFTVEKFGEEDG